MPAPREPTLAQRIRSDILAHVVSGDWPPGHRIPFEHELTETYGCARMTVNKVLTALADQGVLVRRKKAGTFVAPPRLHAMMLEIPDLEAMVRARGQTYAFRILARRVRRPGPQDPPEFVDGLVRVLDVEGLHEAGARPLAHERRLIALDAAPGAEAADFSTLSPGAWLLQHEPWTQAENRIAAAGANAITASRLAIPAGAPCLEITRQTWRGDTRITWVRQWFPAELYDLTARFGPSEGSTYGI
jgi:GntR family histidine utilization transcriptional repressor